MLILQDVTYKHPDQSTIFSDLDMIVHASDKTALVGNNGTGKSTLLKLIAGELSLTSGSLQLNEPPYYIPQLFGQFDNLTIAQALRIDERLGALQAILDGDLSDVHLLRLNDDWTIEERVNQSLEQWQLKGLDLQQPLSSLSGGQKTKVFLAGISIHRPGFVLMDEPSNHLDVGSRRLLYDYIANTNDTLLIVSHDRTLLNLLNKVFELSKGKINVYGGSYGFYQEQKSMMINALYHDLRSKEKSLRKARRTERESTERQQKLDARGKKKQQKAGLPTISMNTFRNNAEKSTARIKGVHDDKIDGIYKELESIKKELPEADKMKIGFDDSSLHDGKALIIARDLNFKYGDEWLWQTPLNFQINNGERWGIAGANGSGKSTLIRLILGRLSATAGSITNAPIRSIYIDQEYSLVQNPGSVYRQAQQFNTSGLAEHEVKSRLTKFLFNKDDWDKQCETLSGGERMRLLLCCLTISELPPDIIVLDEPTNNLDLQNIGILTQAVNEYRGTLIVVSHDAYFLEQVGVAHFIEL